MKRTHATTIVLSILLSLAASAEQPAENMLRRDVEYLASDELQGRMTGSAGERLAVDLRILVATGTWDDDAVGALNQVLPDDLVWELVDAFIQKRQERGSHTIDREEFVRVFDLMSIQRN